MQKIHLQKTSLLFGVLMSIGYARAQSTSVVVTSNPGNAQVKIAVANSAAAQSLVSDKRVVTLTAGRNLVRFSGVPASLDDDSVQPLIAPMDKNGGAVEVLQQRFRPIINATQKAMLQRAIGQKVTVLRDQGVPPITGTLLTTEEVVLLDTPDGIVINPQGTFVVPRTNAQNSEHESFSIAPVLEWIIDAPAAGQYSFEARYAMTGLSWSASYRASLQKINDAERLNLYGWLSLKNASSLDFRNAQVSLLNAGDLKLNESVDLPRGEEKQVSFLRVKDLPVTREWVFWPTRAGDFSAAADYQSLQMMLRLKNIKDNQLGAALPAGVLTVWGASSDGALQRMAQQQIAYTSSGENLWISLGEDASFKGYRSVVASRQLNPVTKEHTIQITLKNDSPQSAAVVIETLPYRAKITEAKVGDADIKPIFLDDNKVQFIVPVPRYGEAVLKYVVEVKS